MVKKITYEDLQNIIKQMGTLPEGKWWYEEKSTSLLVDATNQSLSKNEKKLRDQITIPLNAILKNLVHNTNLNSPLSDSDSIKLINILFSKNIQMTRYQLISSLNHSQSKTIPQHIFSALDRFPLVPEFFKNISLLSINQKKALVSMSIYDAIDDFLEKNPERKDTLEFIQTLDQAIKKAKDAKVSVEENSKDLVQLIKNTAKEYNLKKEIEKQLSHPYKTTTGKESVVPEKSPTPIPRNPLISRNPSPSPDKPIPTPRNSLTSQGQTTPTPALRESITKPTSLPDSNPLISSQNLSSPRNPTTPIPSPRNSLISQKPQAATRKVPVLNEKLRKKIKKIIINEINLVENAIDTYRNAKIISKGIKAKEKKQNQQKNSVKRKIFDKTISLFKKPRLYKKQDTLQILNNLKETLAELAAFVKTESINSNDLLGMRDAYKNMIDNHAKMRNTIKKSGKFDTLMKELPKFFQGIDVPNATVEKPDKNPSVLRKRS